jgi:tetrahydromethanopterin S-methyltransferase subunit F
MWNTRALVAKHKVAALVAGVLLALLLVIVVGGLLTSRPVTVSDSTTCTSWGSTSDTDQLAYARLYVREHGPLAGGVTDPAQVVAAINNGCGEAYVNDVEDNVNVVQALHP